jgi:purine nucleoside phosphorylase
MSDAIGLAVIGGSGLYELGGFWGAVINLETPFDLAPVLVGDLDGRSIAFLCGMGIGHLMPTEIPLSRQHLRAQGSRCGAHRKRQCL